MRRFRFYHVDVFTDRRFGGNPLAVFPDAMGLSDEEMQAIARELNLSETTFVLPAEAAGADHRVRIFTPVKEIPFAGHPTLGTHFVLAQLGRIPLGQSPTRVRQEVGVGVLPVDIHHRDGAVTKVSMTQAPPQFLQTVDDLEGLAHGLSCTVGDFDLDFARPQVVSTGLPFLLVPVRSLEALGRLQLNAGPLLEVCRKYGSEMAYAFTLETHDPGHTAHARFFSGLLLFEDPATGSAAGTLTAFLAKNGITDANGETSYVIEQGHFIQRPSKIYGRAERKDDSFEITVAGECRMVYEADLILE